MEGLLYNATAADPDYMRKKRKAEAKAGRTLTNEEFERDYLKTGGAVD